MRSGNILKFLSLFCLIFVVSCGENKCSYLGDISNFQGVPSSNNSPSWLQSLPKMLSNAISDRLFGEVIPDDTKDINGNKIIQYNGLIGKREMSINTPIASYIKDDPSTHTLLPSKEREAKRGTVYNMYAGIVRSPEYRTIYYLGLVLYIVVLGLTYLLGMTEMTVQKSLPIFIKIGFISFFTNPTLSGATGMPIGWTVYYGAIVAPAIYAMEAFAMYFASNLFNVDINQVENGFVPVAIMLSFLGNGTFWSKMTTLLFSGAPMGFATFIIIFIAIGIYTISAVLSIFTYMVIISTLGILFAIGPVFFIFLLFEKTKPYFEKWWKQILALMFQQYSLFIAISVFGFIIIECMKSMLAFPVSCQAVITLKFLPALCHIGVCLDFPLFYYYIADLNSSGTLTLAMYAVFLWMLVAIYASSIQKIAQLGAGLVDGASAVGGELIGHTSGAWDKVSTGVANVASNLTSNLYQAPSKLVADITSGRLKNDLANIGNNIDKGKYLDAIGSLGSVLGRTTIGGALSNVGGSLVKEFGGKPALDPSQTRARDIWSSAFPPAQNPTPPLLKKTETENKPTPPVPAQPPANSLAQPSAQPLANSPDPVPAQPPAQPPAHQTYTSLDGSTVDLNANAYVFDTKTGLETPMAQYLHDHQEFDINAKIDKGLVFGGVDGNQYGVGQGLDRPGNDKEYTYRQMIEMSQPPQPVAPPPVEPIAQNYNGA